MINQYIYEYLSNIVGQENRLFEKETECCTYIKKKLEKLGINYTSQTYETFYPRFLDRGLSVDSIALECYPCSFSSWVITENNTFDSLKIKESYRPWICFNSASDFLSIPNIYYAPTLAIAQSDKKILHNGDLIKWFVNVKRERFIGENIIVWNIEKPKKIVMCHYDSRFSGACDNAIWVAVLLYILPDILKSNMVVFSGSEEVSYEQPYRWCGYRKCENTFLKQFNIADEIIILDSFGYWKNIVYTEPSLIKSAYWTLHYDFLSKSKVYSSEIGKLMEIYHSKDDTIDKINNIDIDEIIWIISQIPL